MGLDDIIKEITHETESIVNTKTLVGEPTTWEGKTIMPIMKVSAGFGSAGGENHQGNGKDGYAGGGYAGVNMEPIGFVVISEEDVRLLTLSGRSSFNSIIDVIPELAARLPQTASRVREAGSHMAEDVNRRVRERRERRSQEGKSSVTEMVREGAGNVGQRVRDMQAEEGSLTDRVKQGAEKVSQKVKDMRGSSEADAESESDQPFGSRSMEEGGTGGNSESFGGRGGA